MSKPHSLFDALQQFPLGNGQFGSFYSLPALEKAGVGDVSRLPVSIQIVLESILRNCDGKKVSEESVKALAQWQPRARRTEEVPFVVARIVLQDFTGVPLLVDLAAMRSAVARLGKNAKLIEPLVPVDLVVDHSVQVDFAGTSDALNWNLELEFRRNRERYQFLKWGMQAFDTFKVVPPGIGIVHQVNLEYLAKGVQSNEGIYYPDTLVGTDSHTTMINGLGIVGWGVGGIEAEAGMLGQPVYFLTPDVVGVHLTGSICEGVTATDVALHVTQMLRKAKVVGKFVEYYGPGATKLPVADRATIANMAPEYGATMGYFPVDEETVKYLRATGRTDEQCTLFENYFRAQNLFGIPERGQVDYSADLDLDLAKVKPSVAGPKRPQDRIELDSLKTTWDTLLRSPISEGGYGKREAEVCATVRLTSNRPSADVASQTAVERATAISPSESETRDLHPAPDNSSSQSASDSPAIDTRVCTGDIVIAAITSCTNTSNPSVMIAAGLLAKKAVTRGLKLNPVVKASLAPGSRVVSDYLKRTGLQKYLDELGFNLVGYGCTTCIGNSGPIAPAIEQAIIANDLISASVLSGNRNFEARVHQNVKANFLMSPPLVVAFALAGKVSIDLTTEPIGTGTDEEPVFLRDIWPTLEEIRDHVEAGLMPEVFQKLYSDFAGQNPMWNEIPAPSGDVYEWDEKSTYIQEPPFFNEFSLKSGAVPEIVGARTLAIFGDSVTTDHISPAGNIKKGSAAAKFLVDNGVNVVDFNSYGSRRGNDRIMTRGTFANVRIKNLMVSGSEGGVTKHLPEGKLMSIYDAAIQYQSANVPLIVIAGQEYGTGSSRDWAAKGTRLLGVRAVVAQSFERIHRSNLVGMGVLPLQFAEGVSAKSLRLNGSETYDVVGLSAAPKPQQDLTLRVIRDDGTSEDVPVRCRIDTPIETEYYVHGGILPYVLRELIRST